MQTETPKSIAEIKEVLQALDAQIAAEREPLSKKDAYRIVRMFYRIHQQIERALTVGRHDDALSMARLTGTLEVRIFGAHNLGSEDK